MSAAQSEQPSATAVAMEISGKTYQFQLGVNAMAKLEQLMSTREKTVTITDVFADVERNSITATRALVWAALTEHHPDMTLDKVGALIDADGGIFAFADKLAAITGTMPGQKSPGKAVRRR